MWQQQRRFILGLICVLDRITQLSSHPDSRLIRDTRLIFRIGYAVNIEAKYR